MRVCACLILRGGRLEAGGGSTHQCLLQPPASSLRPQYLRFSPNPMRTPIRVVCCVVVLFVEPAMRSPMISPYSCTSEISKRGFSAYAKPYPTLKLKSDVALPVPSAVPSVAGKFENSDTPALASMTW